MLFRAAHHSDVLEVELLRRNIPFVKYGGLKFLEAAHVKDALAMLRVLENPHDEVAWFRVLQLPDGMGPASARRVMDTIGVRRADGADPVVNLLDHPIEVPKGSGDGVQALRSALAGCLDEEVASPAAQLERVRTYLEPVIARKYASASRGSPTSTSSRCSPAVTSGAAGSWRSSRSIRRPPAPTSPVRRASTRTT